MPFEKHCIDKSVTSKKKHEVLVKNISNKKANSSLTSIRAVRIVVHLGKLMCFKSRLGIRFHWEECA